jgi:hypothetical protein
MDENFDNTTKPSLIMREVLVIPKPGLGMLATLAGGLLASIVVFGIAAAMESACSRLARTKRRSFSSSATTEGRCASRA